MSDAPRVLFVSNLFPDTTEPGRGLFNARIVRHLGARCAVRVIAPRPSWRLRADRRQARPEDAAATPSFPRAWYVPRVGHQVNHLLMAEALRGPMTRLHRIYPYDVVLASWIYPDACGAIRVADRLGVPVVAVAQGSDVNAYLEVPARRRVILSHLARAAGVVTRSEALRRLLVEAGVEAGKVRVIYNGVDGEIFHPGDRAEARRALGWADDDEAVLYVGNLVPVKNPGLLVDAFARVVAARPRARLIVAGDGAQRATLEARAHARVRFVGRKPEREVAALMRAADVLCVPSDNEGVPNVLLEGLACGLPAVATRVGGIPEIVDRPELGRLVPRGDEAALATALIEALAAPPDRDAIAAVARGRFSWGAAIDAYVEVLSAAVTAGRSRR